MSGLPGALGPPHHTPAPRVITLPGGTAMARADTRMTGLTRATVEMPCRVHDGRTGQPRRRNRLLSDSSLWPLLRWLERIKLSLLSIMNQS